LKYIESLKAVLLASMKSQFVQLINAFIILPVIRFAFCLADSWSIRDRCQWEAGLCMPPVKDILTYYKGAYTNIVYTYFHMQYLWVNFCK